SFINDVEPVLTKQGCNMGTCHGAGSGKGGFRLTLRGYDPDLDYARICFEGRSRRLVASHPEESLFLKKPSLAVSQLGGLRLRRGSTEDSAIAHSIASGAGGPDSHSPTVTRIQVYPPSRTLTLGTDQRLQVTGPFSDGNTQDVTHWARFA